MKLLMPPLFKLSGRLATGDRHTPRAVSTPSAPLATPNPPLGSPPIILLIDDDAAVRDSLRRVLETEGWTVVTADGGENAVHYVQSRLPELIITDLCMAGINGWDLLLEHRLEYPVLPIFVISALESKFSRGADQVATQFFQKPVDLDALLDAVRRHLGVPGPISSPR